jgi:hypothetical protein
MEYTVSIKRVGSKASSTTSFTSLVDAKQYMNSLVDQGIEFVFTIG